MKKILFLLALTIGLIGSAKAQQDIGITNALILGTKTDSSAIINLTSSTSGVSYFFSTTDSTKFIIFTDYTYSPSFKWATTSPDTIISTDTTGYSIGVVLRGYSSNRIAGATQIRFRVQQLSSGNSKKGTRRYNLIAVIGKNL